MLQFNNLELIIFPNKILTTKCEILNGEEILNVILNYNKIIEFKEKIKGVGLAAPQIGLNKRFFIMEKELFINPEILKYSNDNITLEESCLSLPNESYEIKRSLRVRIKYIGLDNKIQNKYFTGQKARIVQHEFDHLNGKLINGITV